MARASLTSVEVNGSDGEVYSDNTYAVPGLDLANGPTDLITADGRYLGTLAPEGVRIPQAFGPDGLIVRREVDEFDVPTLIVERIPTDID